MNTVIGGMLANINAIYLATEGEGVFVGTPQIFVRFQGCEHACINCDSPETWSFKACKEFTIENLLKEIWDTGHDGKIKRVSITGGNPLNPKNLLAVRALIRELKGNGYFVNIEASGQENDGEVFDLVDFISLDFKTPSTGLVVDVELFKKILALHEKKIQVKAVIETEEDFKEIFKERTTSLKGFNHCYWVLTPAYNVNESLQVERFKNVLQWNEQNGALFRVIGQQHKFIFGPNEKEV